MSMRQEQVIIQHTTREPVLQKIEGVKPAPGMAWNPLLKWERNLPCPCKSGKKFKHCHLPTMPKCVPQGMAVDLKKIMDGEAILDVVDDPNLPYGVQK